MRLLLVIACLLLAMPAQAADLAPFVRGSWQQLRQAHAGRPTIVHFWGLTCGPCLTELPEWGRLLAERPDADLVLVAADPIPEEPASLAATLRKSGLGSAESWAFADDFAERLRFEIDPRWRGEMPRTILITGDGTVTATTGVSDMAALRAWIVAQTTQPGAARR
jgi:thiol-disulfide isomerase/thioredoxin